MEKAGYIKYCGKFENVNFLFRVLMIVLENQKLVMLEGVLGNSNKFIHD